ncbi:MAG: ABC transporter permease subunit [Ilumatobacter sp.]
MSMDTDLAADEAAEPEAAARSATRPTVPDEERENRTAGWYVVRVIGAIAFVIFLVLFATESKMRSTVFTVVISVSASAALWVGANLLFNEVRERWARFLAIAFGVLGALLGMLLHGNRLTLGSGTGFFTWVLGPLVGAAVFVGIGAALARTNEASQRLAIGLGSGAVVGIGIGALIRSEYHPFIRVVPTIVCLAIGIAVGAAIALLRGRSPITGVIYGAALGWIFGAWGGADLGGGTIATSIIAALVPALLVGFAIGRTQNPDYRGRADIDLSSRAVIFLGPALLFIFIMLVVPTLRTIFLSLLDRDSEDFVWFENYGSVFTDRQSWDASEWTNLFTSQLTWIGVFLLAIAAVLGVVMFQRTGRAVEIGNPTMAPLVTGGLFLAFGIFTSIRGTIANNLWWVVSVTFFSTAMGLAVAVLADNKRGEKIAKALIFLPMAISLVGASIIWRFVYQARDTSKPQTGIINAVWTRLGDASTGSGLGNIIGTVLFGLALLGSLVFLVRSLTTQEYGKAAVPGVLTLITGWLFLKYMGIIGLGLGGFKVEDGQLAGESDTVLFVQEGPFNNFFLMIILIWIQTGFAMVILSAAIKAVPDELIEAAKMDGATESQVFWRVVLPQISTTIGVVVTTIIVLVMKVFDIVKVTTNGQFDTNVLANDMFDEAFNIVDRGKGAALAILIFVSVLPVMISNIRRMQKEN